MKTNAMRILDSEKIGYEVLEYDTGDREFSGTLVADLLGLDYGSCYKTLTLIHEHDVYLAVISVDKELDLKKCAKALNVKNLEMVHVKDLLKTIGYERGSVSPVGTKRVKGIIFDNEANNYEKIEISGGMKGISLLVDREEIIGYLKAKTGDITKI